MQALSNNLTVPTRFLDALREGVAIVAPSGRILAANAALCGLLGLSVDDVVDRSVLQPPWQLESPSLGTIAAADSTPVLALDGSHHPEVTVFLHGAGVAHWVKLRVTRLDPFDPAAGIVAVFEDLTEVVLAQHNLRNALHADPLTGLATRERITAVAAESLDRLASHGPPNRVGILHVDLDGFRLINDSFGPAVGDAVLVEVAARLCALSTPMAEVGRVGVDEFLIVTNASDAGLGFDTSLRELADAIRRSIATPITHDGLELHLTASIGAARGPDDATTAVGLLSAADRAVRAGRQMGRNQFRFHDLTIDIRNHEKLRLDRDLRMATARRELEVYYQPIIDVASGGLAGAEALVRWHHGEHGPVPPSEFIPTAEATGSISAISEFVMGTVADDLRSWTTSGVFPPNSRVSVNISAAEFNRTDFLDRLTAVIENTGTDPRRLELEITESLLVDDLAAAAERIREIDRLGMRVAIDDFGTGYSSLSYLHELPLHTLKIDRRFIADSSDDRAGAVAATIVSLAQNLGFVTVAEGLEYEHQRSFLARSGCELAQGFLFAPPLPKATFERYLLERHPVAAL